MMDIRREVARIARGMRRLAVGVALAGLFATIGGLAAGVTPGDLTWDHGHPQVVSQ